MANYTSMVWLESWWNTILRIEDPVIRDDRTRRMMEYGFHHVKNLSGLDVDGRAFMEETFSKMDEMKEKHDRDTVNGKKGGQAHSVYDYEGLGVRQMFIDGLKMSEIAERTGIPYDSIRKWSGRPEAEAARKALKTGKPFPIEGSDIPEIPVSGDESALSETGKTGKEVFPVGSDDIPEKKKSFPINGDNVPENKLSGEKSVISETGKGTFPVSRSTTSEWNCYGF